MLGWPSIETWEYRVSIEIDFLVTNLSCFCVINIKCMPAMFHGFWNNKDDGLYQNKSDVLIYIRFLFRHIVLALKNLIFQLFFFLKNRCSFWFRFMPFATACIFEDCVLLSNATIEIPGKLQSTIWRAHSDFSLFISRHKLRFTFVLPRVFLATQTTFKVCVHSPCHQVTRA